MFGRMHAALAHGQSHRTGAPVRRNSRLKGKCEAGFWRAIDRKTAWRIVLAAKRFEKAHKQAGKKSGPLGAVAIEVLEYMANLVDYRSGRLEPSIDTIMKKLCRSRDAVWKALTALRRHGFLDWVRRYVPTHNDSAGPQVQQTSNAYRLALPKQAEEALARDTTPLPEDRAQADLEKMTAEAEHELQRIGRDGLEWLAQAETPAGRRARMLLNLCQSVNPLFGQNPALDISYNKRSPLFGPLTRPCGGSEPR